MTISIIIPVYNVESYIRDCLMSVMRQTYTGKMECLIVDDCGTDDSIIIAEQMIADYERPIQFQILHHHHNRGLSAARNTGMDAATGDYIFFLDGDDELTNDCIEKLTEPLKNEWYDVVLGLSKNVEVLSKNHTNVVKNTGEITITEDILLKSPHIIGTFGKKWSGVAWNRLYRLGFLQQHQFKFKEGIIFEDILWCFQIACVAKSFYLVSYVSYVYKIRDDGIMGHSTKQDYIDNFTIIIKDSDSFLKNNRIYRGDTFSYFNYLFSVILKYSSSSVSDYVSAYRNVSPYVNVSFKNIIKANDFNLKCYLRKLHYLMPTCIAPYWQYYVFVILRGFYRKIMRK